MKFVNFYRRFIKNFSKLVKSFTQLTRKNTSFVWNEICVQVFDNLKKQVSSISVLRHFDLKRQAILKTDASNYVKDEILSQYDDEKDLHEKQTVESTTSQLSEHSIEVQLSDHL